MSAFISVSNLEWEDVFMSRKCQNVNTFDESTHLSTAEWASLPFISSRNGPHEVGVSKQLKETIPILSGISTSFLSFPNKKVESNQQQGSETVALKFSTFCKRSLCSLNSKVDPLKMPKFKVAIPKLTVPKTLGSFKFKTEKPTTIDDSCKEELVWGNLSLNKVDSKSDTSLGVISRPSIADVSVRSSPKSLASVANRTPSFQIPSFGCKKEFELREFKLQPSTRPAAFEDWFKKSFMNWKVNAVEPEIPPPGHGIDISGCSVHIEPASASAFDAPSIDTMHILTHDQSPVDARSFCINEQKCFSELPFFAFDELFQGEVGSKCLLEVPVAPQIQDLFEIDRRHLRMLERRNSRVKKRLRSKTKDLVDHDSAKSIPLAEAMWNNIDAMARALSLAGSENAFGEYPLEVLTKGRLRRKKRSFVQRRDLGLVGLFDLEAESPFPDYLVEEDFDLFS